jgi:hypothetical protein
MNAKLSSISLAAMCVVAGSAHALNVNISGSSATGINAAKALVTACQAVSGNVARLYRLETATSVASNTSDLTATFTVTCEDSGGVAANFGASGYDQARFTLNGSLNAVSESAQGNPLGTGVARLDPAASTCTPLGTSAQFGTGALTFLRLDRFSSCAAGTGTTLALSDAGFMDIEGKVFNARGSVTQLANTNLGTDFPASAFQQAFGVAVSADLYNLMQAYQVAKGTLDATCATTSGTAPVTYTATGSALPLCQPNITKGQYTALINGTLTTPFKQAGANYLIGGTTTTVTDLDTAAVATLTGLPVVKSLITVHRRSTTSGTTAAGELFFLANPTGQGSAGGSQAVRGAFTGATGGTPYSIILESDTTAVKTGLNSAGYHIGVLSLENNPVGGSDTYRFLKLNGVSGSEGVAGASQTANAITGNYDFFFDLFKYCPAGVCNPILTTIETNIGPGASSAGIFTTAEAKATRGGVSTRTLTAK